jgi:putative acetyltransferase
MALFIRPESPEDFDAITALTIQAFAPMPFAGGNEQDLIIALRRAGALPLSLVAVQDDEIVGHAGFSPATTADGEAGWFALGPISVQPEHQKRGVGRALIAAGFDGLKKQGARGCIVVGDPAYYPRHGFVPAPELSPSDEPAEFFMVATFGDERPRSKFAFHPVFYV